MCMMLIGASLSKLHQMLQRFQINAFQHQRKVDVLHSNVSARGNGI